MSRILKPLPGTPINYHHPLCPISFTAGAGSFLLPLDEGSGTPRAYLGPKPGAAPSTGGTERLGTFTSAGWSTAPRSRWGGPTAVLSAVGGNIDFGIAGDFLGTDNATIVMGYNSVAPGVFRHVFIIDSSTSSHICKVGLASAGQAFWYFGGTTVGTSELDSPTGLTLGDDVWVFTVGGRGMEIWQNGSLLASQTGHASRTGSSNTFRLGSDAFWGDADLGHFAFFYIYDRQLTADEARQISADPFCFYDWGEDTARGPATTTQNLAGTLTTAGALTASALHKRLYFDSVASAAAAPVFDGGWSSTTGADRKRLNHVKQSSAITAGSIISWANAANTKALNRQYISSPLNGAQAISGTVKMQLQVREEDNGDNVNRIFLAIKVVSNDGSTVRGTLLAHGNYGPTAEFFSGGFTIDGIFTPEYRNKTGADGDSLTLVNALDGDRILVEIGYSNSTGGASPEARALWGDTGTDLGEDETTQAPVDSGQPGWIEFSTSLSFREPTAQSLGGAATPAGNVIKLIGKIL